MVEWFKLLIPGLLGLTTAVVAAWLSAKWAVQRFNREKWWERRERAYSEIIDALHDMIRYCDMMKDVENHLPDTTEHPKKREFSEKYSEAHWRISKATDIGAFVISEQAAQILHRLKDSPSLDWEEHPLWEVYEQDLHKYRRALDDLRAVARRDLGV